MVWPESPGMETRPGWLPCARIPAAARGRLQRQGRVWKRGLAVVSQSIRVEDSVTSLSWIPREAIEGMTKIPFEVSVTRYDQPPPDRLTEGDLETLQDAGRFRFVNRLRA